MSELEPSEIDDLVRRSLAAPQPSLPSDFEQRLMLEAHRRSQPIGRSGRILLVGYALASVLASVVVMRGQGLHWTMVGAAIIVPLGLLGVLPAFSSRSRSS